MSQPRLDTVTKIPVPDSPTDEQSRAERRSQAQQRLAIRRLMSSGYPGLKRLTCRVEDGVIVLNGRVGSYYLKQLAQTLIKDIRGVTVLVNNLHVDTAPAARQS